MMTLSEDAQKSVERPHYWRDHNEMVLGNAKKEYLTAMLEVQSDVEAVIQADKNNPFTKSKYASLGNVLHEVRTVLNKNGFILEQFAGKISGHGGESKRWYTLPVCTKITHAESEQQQMIICDMPIDQTIHGYGSALTYGKRYGLQSMFGIATVDDDGMAFIQGRIDDEKAVEAAQGIIEQIDACETLEALKKWLGENEDGIKLLSENSVERVRVAYKDKKDELTPQVVEEVAAKGKSKVKSDQMDLEEAIKETAA